MEKIRVLISTFDGIGTDFDFPADATVGDVLNENCYYFGVNPENFSIYFCGNRLDPNSRLSEIGYFPGAILYLESNYNANEEIDPDYTPPDALERALERTSIEELLQRLEGYQGGFSMSTFEEMIRHRDTHPNTIENSLDSYMKEHSHNSPEYPVNIELTKKQRDIRTTELTEHLLFKLFLEANKDVVIEASKQVCDSKLLSDSLNNPKINMIYAINYYRKKHYEMDQSYINSMISKYNIHPSVLQRIFNLSKGDSELTESLVQKYIHYHIPETNES